MLKLKKSLENNLGQDFRKSLNTNFLRTEDFINDFAENFRYHKEDEQNAHTSNQITDEQFKTVQRGLKVINERYSNLVLSKGKNSLQEVKDARVDTEGTAHETLFDRLSSDSVKNELAKDEVMKEVNDAKDTILAQEFAFDIPNQSWQYLTNMSTWTNSVLQSFYLDNVTGLLYSTQAYGDNYKMTKMKSNGQFLSQMELAGGGHGTQVAFEHDIVENKTWIYSHIQRPDGQNALVKFTWRPDVTLNYGEYDMEEVFTGHSDRPYMTPTINEHEGLIMYRIQYDSADWDKYGTPNYVEIRRLEDVKNKVDNVLYRMDIPKHLTSYGDPTQPMQGCSFDDNKLYWYTGDSNPAVSNFLTVFDLTTGKQLYQKEANFGKSGNEFPGNFAEAEGVQIYYDIETGKKALLAAVTVGEGNYRSHQIHGIFMRDVYDKLTAQATPQSLMETGGRTKTLPVKDFNKLSDIIEPGVYYLYTATLDKITDFPVPDELKNAGYFLEVSPPNQAGQVKQCLTRNTFSRDIDEFVRIVSVNKFSDSNQATNWNYIGYSSIGGTSEAVPSFITNMNQLGIIAGKTWYIDTEKSNQLGDFPTPGVAGWTCLVENVTSSRFKVTLTRVSSTAPVEMIIAYFSSTGKPERISSWTQFKGTNL